MTKNVATPPGWRAITPRIVARDAKKLVAFIAHVFDATGDYAAERPTLLTIGDSMLMISDAGVRPTMPAFLYVYVNDTDATYARAIAAGARIIEPPLDTPYGDRRCMIEDSWGNTWQIATFKSDLRSQPYTARRQQKNIN
ncbi:MAG TPA: VOC family protein [Pyrinomonadaceae bacterium]|nr:VOC family protein [Pyrinomonadaceae bacterium]